jgi:hypothetical protein
MRLLLLPSQGLAAHSSGPLFVSVHNLVKVSIDTILAAQRLLYCTFKFFTSTQNRSPLCIEYLAHSPAQSSLSQRPSPPPHPSFRFLYHISNVIGSQHAIHESKLFTTNPPHNLCTHFLTFLITKHLHRATRSPPNPDSLFFLPSN